MGKWPSGSDEALAASGGIIGFFFGDKWWVVASVIAVMIGAYQVVKLWEGC
jgi:hypothetical protein